MKRALKVISMVLIGIASTQVGRLLSQHFPLAGSAAAGQQWQLSWGLLVVLPVSLLLAVAVHELGHAWAGQWLGFRFYWLTVGPFRWERQGESIRFRWNTHLYAAGGLVLSVPTDDRKLRSRYMAFTAAGPLASLLWAALALGAYHLLPAPGKWPLGVLALGISGSVSALIGVLTLVPVRRGGIATDGSRLLSLGRNGLASRVETAVLAVMARAVAGVRPREWSLTELEALRELPDNLPFKPFVYYYLYLAALDGGGISRAGHYLSAYRRCLPHLPLSLHGSVWLESAFFAAAYEGDLPAAHAMQAQAEPSALTPADLLPRVQAAQARLLGEAPQAFERAQLALRSLARNPDLGSQHFYAEWLTSIITWATQHQACPLPKFTPSPKTSANPA
jgi:hypothetical protein